MTRLETERLANDLLLVTRHALALATKDVKAAAVALKGIQTFVTDPASAGHHNLSYEVLVTVPFLARHGQVDAALQLLRQLEDRTPIPYDWLRDHPYLESLRRAPQFQGILSRARTRFQDMASVLRSAQAIGELPDFMVTPLDELVDRLGLTLTK